MDHIMSFNEKFGILKSLQEQCDLFFHEIQNNLSENFFHLIYNLNGNSYDFIIEIDNKLKNLGTYILNIQTNAKKIVLRNRNSKSVLLHELKHLDYSIRKPNYSKTILKKSHDILGRHIDKSFFKRKSNEFVDAKEIFYFIDQNEFEARYHGYYIDLIEFIDKKLEEKTKNDRIYPSNRRKQTLIEIGDLYIDFLEKSSDRSWLTYTYKENFKFENYFNGKQINNLFFFLSDKKIDLNILKYVFNNIKNFFKAKLNRYSETDLANIEKLKKKYEEVINKKLRSYNTKFTRLYKLMVDKYC